jgi:hypothetical protein
MTAAATNGRLRTPRVIEALALGDEPAGLNDALLAFAADAPKLTTNADGQARGGTYRYANLDGVLDDVAPLLVKHGLVWKVRPTIADGQPAARYSMTHVPSGEVDEDLMPLPGATTPQTLGSALTYMRRYALVAYLNLAPGDDDDGASASTGRPPVDRYAPNRGRDWVADSSPGRLNAAPSTAAVNQPTARPATGSERPASAKQRALIEARARDADLTPDELANVLKKAGGEETVIWQDGAAARWSRRALDRLPARLVDDVLEGIAR